MTTAEIPHVPLFPYTTPNAPDLGCFVRNKHGLETYDFPIYEEPSPWEISGGRVTFFDHQMYFRVKCGKAGFYQRCLVYMRDAYADANDVIGAVPDFVLGGDYLPYPSDWMRYPPQHGGRTYFFLGEYRDPSQTLWQWDVSVGHSYDMYDYGTLATVQWDDTGGDRDYNDLVVEVAVVRRPWYFTSFASAASDREALKRFVDTDPAVHNRPPH